MSLNGLLRPCWQDQKQTAAASPSSDEEMPPLEAPQAPSKPVSTARQALVPVKRKAQERRAVARICSVFSELHVALVAWLGVTVASVALRQADPEPENLVQKAMKSEVARLKRAYTGEDIGGHEMPLLQTPPNHESTVVAMEEYTPSPIGQQTVFRLKTINSKGFAKALGFKAAKGKEAMELVKVKKPTVCSNNMFGEYDLKALGVPEEAYPPRMKLCHGKHGYTVVCAANNAAFWRENAVRLTKNK